MAMERLIDIVSTHVKKDPLALHSLLLRVQLVSVILVLIGAIILEISVKDMVLIR